MRTEERKKFIINIVYFAVIATLVILFVRYALPVLTPFVIAAVVALILSPVVRFCDKHLHIRSKWASIILVVLFYIVVGLLLITASVEISKALINLVIKIPGFYNDSVEPFLTDLLADSKNLLEKLPDSTEETIFNSANNMVSGLGETLTSISLKLISILGNTASSVPGILVNVIITIISTVFFSIDGRMIWAFLVNQLSEQKAALVVNVTASIKKILGKYISSYAIIMFITFLELLAGLLIIGISNTVFLAGLIAVFDILPIVGSGLITLPWAIISLLQGNTSQGIGLLIMWAVISVVRNIIEPKIVGDKVGLHPIATLIAMVFGTFMFGGIGILLFPITLAVIQNLNNSGVIHIYNPLPPHQNEKKTKTILEPVKSVLVNTVKKICKK